MRRNAIRMTVLTGALVLLAVALAACGGTPTNERESAQSLIAAHESRLGRETVEARRQQLAAALSRLGIETEEHEFAALLSFCCDLGTDWLDGTSLLARIVRGETEETRLETARAFGMWCHVNGAADETLAARRLEEAALWLDGDAAAARKEFCYLAIRREADVGYLTDFWVYGRGGTYDTFPPTVRLGYTAEGFRADDGRILRLGDRVMGSETVEPVWKRNDYAGLGFSDVTEEDPYYDYVMELCAAGAVEGRADGTFAPLAPATVEEMRSLLRAAAGKEPPEQAGGPITRRAAARLCALTLGAAQSIRKAVFDDTEDGYAAVLSELDVLTAEEGEDGLIRFRPDDILTRAEACELAWRVRRAVLLEKRQSLVYINSHNTYALAVLDGVPKYSYDRDAFTGTGREMDYAEPGVTVRQGIDVSKFQGEIDWNAVKADGIDFAILRVGGRYFGSGKLYDDDRFAANLRGAKAAGVDVGVYFFSQAITPEEAVEEADHLLSWIQGVELEMPVVFDWELSGKSGARTNGLSAEAVTDCAVAFCERVRAAGYRPMVYFTKYQGYVKYDLSRLTDAAFWYADDYEDDRPVFFYDFTLWQYSTRGRVAGIDGDVDLDLWLEREM